ncbi:hypothetical protein NKG05_11190 [Oerskovia sp. M15]
MGVDRIPLGYYQAKVEVEQMLAASGLPHTILRATQFPQLIVGLFTAQRFSPVLLTPSLEVQPIAVPDVAARLVEIVAAGPSGRVGDVGGPQRITGRRPRTPGRVQPGAGGRSRACACRARPSGRSRPGTTWCPASLRTGTYGQHLLGRYGRGGESAPSSPFR